MKTISRAGFVATGLLSFLALTACKKDLTAITDDQILTVFGEINPLFTATVTIPEVSVECIKKEAQLSIPEFDEAPAEMRAYFIVLCDQMFNETFEGPDAVDLPIERADLSDKEFAQRIFDLAAMVDDDARKARELYILESRRQREAEDEAELNALREQHRTELSDAQEFLSNLNERKELAVILCSEYFEAHNAAHTIAVWGKIERDENFEVPSICGGFPRESIFTRFNDYVARLEDHTPRIGLFSTSIPKRPDVSLDLVDQEIEDLPSKTEYLRAFIEEHG